MTIDDLKDLEKNYSESKIQHTCVKWFRDAFPALSRLLISVPNGGYRSARAGAQMAYEGQMKGVSDLILVSNRINPYTLCIEMKVPKKKGRAAGRQSTAQQDWEAAVIREGNTYVVCHGLAEFIDYVCAHLHDDAEHHITRALTRYPMYL